MGDHERSARQSLRAVELRPDEEGPAYWNAITSLVNAGRVDEAEAMVDSAEKVWGSESPRARIMVLAAQGRLDEGEIALAEGRPEAAIELFRRAFQDFCHICPLPGLARAYEAASQPDSAIAALTRYVETPYSDRFLPYTYPLGQALAPAHERLAKLQDDARNLDEAAKHYARFVELWSDADEELQPRVRAAQARLDRIVSERG